MTAEKRPERKPVSISSEMKNSEFHRFFVDELKDIYGAEKHLAKSLPKMQKASNSEDLAAAFEKHTKETETHTATLEEIFELLDEKAAAHKCEAMQGLLEEGLKTGPASSRNTGFIITPPLRGGSRAPLGGAAASYSK